MSHFICAGVWWTVYQQVTHMHTALKCVYIIKVKGDIRSQSTAVASFSNLCLCCRALPVVFGLALRHNAWTKYRHVTRHVTHNRDRLTHCHWPDCNRPIRNKLCLVGILNIRKTEYTAAFARHS